MSSTAEIYQPSDHPTCSAHLSCRVKGEDHAHPMRRMQNATATNYGLYI